MKFQVLSNSRRRGEGEAPKWKCQALESPGKIEIQRTLFASKPPFSTAIQLQSA